MSHSRRSSHSRVFLSGLLMVIAGACGDSTPVAPTAPTIPVPAPSPAAETPYKVTGLTGVYDVSVTVDGFDPAWGDLTGYRFSGVLTLEDGAGSLSEFRLFDAAGEPAPSGPQDGSVTPRPSAGIALLQVGQLIHFYIESIDEQSPGQASSPRFSGRFWLGHVSGPFVAFRRTS
jgi:hypothetical protein